MAPESFIFSLRNADNLAPFKAALIDKYHFGAVTHIGKGPTSSLRQILDVRTKLLTNTATFSRKLFHFWQEVGIFLRWKSKFFTCMHN